MSGPEIIGLGSGDRLRDVLQSQSIISIDTEFMRERTYFSQLCLVQISAGETILCLDPLGDDTSDEQQMWSMLLDVPWVLHSGRQDIEVIYQTTDVMPTSVWDTQIAAALLGYPPQVGYGNLVAELFDVQLAKSHTRADWSRRPLTDGLLQYAAEDVLYLLPAADKLMARLDALGRGDWAREDSAAMLNPSLYDVDPANAVGRLKGARNVRGSARNIAVRLAAWRENEALKRNRPRQWIVKDTVLLDIAHNKPKTLNELQRIEGLAERTAQRASTEILAAVSKGETDRDDYRPPDRPDESQRALLKSMKKCVDDVAGELNIAAEVIAPKKDLSAVIHGERENRLFSGWRNEIIGEALLKLIP